ncbi:MAG: WD40 repeat domain-containing serine/threonine protein kinase [Pirellulaceae bacterium]
MLEKGDEPVPGYRLEGYLGRGQFGEVWRATSPGGAQVALKFLNLDERQGVKEFRAIQRFKTIRYPHLATVTALWLLDDAGHVLDDVAADAYDSPPPTVRGTLWPDPQVESSQVPHRLVVATLLCDKNLMDRLAECQAQGFEGIPVDELLRYMEEAAKAIDFLNAQRHDLGDGPVAIQHCDIKPANIMLTGGSVMICDFGVAAFLGNPRIAATATSMAGSPAYMSPECTQCKPSAASDQYSLAVTYVELRTGRLPFRSQTWIDVIDAHRSGTLDLSPLPRSEQGVIRKATSVNPEDRYPSTVAFVRALRQSVESAGGPTPAGKLVRTLATATLGIVLMAAIGWGALKYLPSRNHDQQPPLTGAGSVVPDVSISFQVVPADAEVVVDGQAVTADADGQVSLMRAPDAEIDVTVRKPPEYLETREQLTTAELKSESHVFQLNRDPEYVRQLAQSHAGRAFEIIDSDEPQLPNLERAAAEYQQTLMLDKARYAVVPPFARSLNDAEQDYSFTIRCLAIHPQKPWLVARLGGTKLALWNLDDLDAQPTVLHEHAGHVCNVLAAGSYAASADLTGQIKLTRLDENGRPQETLDPPGLSGLEMAISPDLQWFIAGEYEGNVLAWKLNGSGDDQAPVLIGQHMQSVGGIVVTPDSQWVITAGAEEGSVCKWNLQTPDSTAADAQLGSQSGDVVSLAISPDGRWVAFGGDAQTNLEFPISCIDLTQNTVQRLPQGHTAPVSALVYDQFAPHRAEQSDSARLASGSEDGQLRVYDADVPRLLDSRRLAGIKSLTFCPAPDWLVSGSDDGTVGIWDLLHADRKPLVLRGNAGRVVQVAVTPQWLIVGYYNGVILLWDLRRCILVKRAADEQGIELHDPSDGPGTIKA